VSGFIDWSWWLVMLLVGVVALLIGLVFLLLSKVHLLFGGRW
jgi:hypothetical protein